MLFGRVPTYPGMHLCVMIYYHHNLCRTMKYRICHDFHIECDNHGLAVKSRFVESVLAL
jgi:hypothetical protein